MARRRQNLVENFIRNLFSDPQMLRMGHEQRLEDFNLGLGWIYYSLGRVLKPKTAVVIGSYRGFVPSLIGKALLDNGEGGKVVFIDPSHVDDFWRDPQRVNRHFSALGTPNVEHHCSTTQDFVTTQTHHALSGIGLLMVDGFHSAEQARFDYLAFADKLSDDAIVLFHDSVSARTSTIYGKDKQYDYTVHLFMERLRRTTGLEVFTLPFGPGLTMVRGRPCTRELIDAPFESLSGSPA